MATHDTIVIGASAGGVQALSAIVIEKQRVKLVHGPKENFHRPIVQDPSEALFPNHCCVERKLI